MTNLVVTRDYRRRVITTGPDAIKYDDTLWEDLTFPVQNLRVNPSTSKPDFDFANVEYLFDDSSTETVVGANQMSHTYLEGSDLHPHVHWTQDASGTVLWQLEYKMWNLGEAEPGSFTTITTSTTAFTYTSGDLGQLSIFPIISGTGKTISFNIKVKISRLGGSDTKSGDALFTSFDIHYEKNSPGSRTELAK
jgi:hypothetical protein